MYGEDAGRDAHLPDGREILDWIVGHLLVEPGIDRMRRHRRHQQRVAVRRRFRDDIGADIAARAGPVLHHEWLSEQLRHSRTHDACDGIRRTAGGERHHQPYRFRWIAVLRERKAKAERQANKASKHTSFHMRLLPGTFCARPMQQKSPALFRARAFSLLKMAWR